MVSRQELNKTRQISNYWQIYVMMESWNDELVFIPDTTK